MRTVPRRIDQQGALFLAAAVSSAILTLVIAAGMNIFSLEDSRAAKAAWSLIGTSCFISGLSLLIVGAQTVTDVYALRRDEHRTLLDLGASPHLLISIFTLEVLLASSVGAMVGNLIAAISIKSYIQAIQETGLPVSAVPHTIPLAAALIGSSVTILIAFFCSLSGVSVARSSTRGDSKITPSLWTKSRAAWSFISIGLLIAASQHEPRSARKLDHSLQYAAGIGILAVFVAVTLLPIFVAIVGQLARRLSLQLGSPVGIVAMNAKCIRYGSSSATGTATVLLTGISTVLLLTYASGLPREQLIRVLVILLLPMIFFLNLSIINTSILNAHSRKDFSILLSDLGFTSRQICKAHLLEIFFIWSCASALCLAINIAVSAIGNVSLGLGMLLPIIVCYLMPLMVAFCAIAISYSRSRLP